MISIDDHCALSTTNLPPAHLRYSVGWSDRPRDGNLSKSSEQCRPTPELGPMQQSAAQDLGSP
jgi:hypothetical protein